MVYLYAYVGANPPTPAAQCASSQINLTQVPLTSPGTPAVTCTYVLAFANQDGAGNFSPQWDTNAFSQQNLQSVMAANPWVNFAFSLGGGVAEWIPPGDPQGWVTNAVRSITGIMQAYGLSGVDIDYEQGPGGSAIDHDSFVQVMSQVIAQIKTHWTIAPFTQTQDLYLDLYDATGGTPAINFQAYSLESTNPDDYIAAYTTIKNDPRVTAHGASLLGFGIATDTNQPRGLQYPDVTNLCLTQFQPGSPGLWSAAMVWCMEQSCANGYPVERTLSAQ